MRILIILFLICAVCSFCYAEQCYIFIDKIGIVEKGQEAGQNEYGDVIGIYPYTPQYKPTPAELSRYKVMVIDLTQDEKNLLVEEDGYLDPENNFVITKARKRKIDINKMKSIKQEQVVAKNIIINNLIIKSP